MAELVLAASRNGTAAPPSHVPRAVGPRLAVGAAEAAGARARRRPRPGVDRAARVLAADLAAGHSEPF